MNNNLPAGFKEDEHGDEEEKELPDLMDGFEEEEDESEIAFANSVVKQIMEFNAHTSFK